MIYDGRTGNTDKLRVFEGVYKVFLRARTEDNITTADALKTLFNGAQIRYKLATPTTIQLTPTQLRSLLVLNKIYADCGKIKDVKYLRDLNSCINDIIARIEALEG